jgi:transposase InsO family protein
MKLHANAALSWSGRRRLAERVVVQGWTLTAAAEAAGVSVRCARKWVGRYRSEGPAGLADRSSAPLRVANRTQPDRVQVVLALRRLRFTAAEIAETLGMPLSTVSGILTRAGMGRLGRLGLEQPQRYERSRPGELIHIDVKKLGRFNPGGGRRWSNGVDRRKRTVRDQDGKRRRTVGWEYVHVAIDDYSRLAYAEVLTDEKAATAIGFLRRALAFFARYGIKVEQLLTDNGPAYRSTLHALACRSIGIKHLRTRPRRPQTNGKAERFIRTMINGWAYGAIYGSTTERSQALDGWLWHYNHQRRHSALGHKPPVTRTNLLRSYTRGPPSRSCAHGRACHCSRRTSSAPRRPHG